MYRKFLALPVPLLLLLLSVDCLSLPNDVAIPAPAAPSLVSNAVRCNCVVNRHSDNKQCSDPTLCPGPQCPCPGMDLDLCLPPDLNHDLANQQVRAKLSGPAFDFSAAVERYCAERASEIMIDIGAVSEKDVICHGKSSYSFAVDAPAMINCHAVAYDQKAGSVSTWQSPDCQVPCPDVLCINGPKSEVPSANCDGADVFTWNGLHPETCRCNRVESGNSCLGRDSERFCSPHSTGPAAPKDPTE